MRGPEVLLVKEGKYDILKTASLKLSELGFVNGVTGKLKYHISTIEFVLIV